MRCALVLGTLVVAMPAASNESEVEFVPFEQCVAAVMQTAAALKLKSTLPARASEAFSARFPTTDGYVFVTCNRTDNTRQTLIVSREDLRLRDRDSTFVPPMKSGCAQRERRAKDDQ